MENRTSERTFHLMVGSDAQPIVIHPRSVSRSSHRSVRLHAMLARVQRREAPHTSSATHRITSVRKTMALCCAFVICLCLLPCKAADCEMALASRSSSSQVFGTEWTGHTGLGLSERTFCGRFGSITQRVSHRDADIPTEIACETLQKNKLALHMLRIFIDMRLGPRRKPLTPDEFRVR